MFSLMERMRSASLARDEDKIPLMVISIVLCFYRNLLFHHRCCFSNRF